MEGRREGGRRKGGRRKGHLSECLFVFRGERQFSIKELFAKENLQQILPGTLSKHPFIFFSTNN